MEQTAYAMLRQTVYDLKDRFPGIGLSLLGRSWADRGIFALSLGNIKNPTLYAASFHGQEWITTHLALRFFEEMCTHYYGGAELEGVPVKKALDGKGIIVVPCVNPDGIEIALRGKAGAGSYAAFVEKISGGDYSQWNANARGVDINHNFDAGWKIVRKMEQEMGIHGPAPRRYGGPAPESELETQALVQLCRQRSIRTVIALHSQGEEIYWKYGDHTPERAQMMAKIFAESSGYKLADPDTIASHGGFKDWAIEELHIPGFTIEVGKGVNPLPLSQTGQIYDRIKEMLLLAALM